jgi:hypothetical protein
MTPFDQRLKRELPLLQRSRHVPPQTKKPSLRTLENWVAAGVARSTDGCRVEPDGHCPHGKPSWLIVLGVI